MANKTNKIISAIAKIRSMSNMKMRNHKCTTVRIQDPHLSQVLDAVRRRTTQTTSTTSTQAPMSSGGSSGGGGY